MLILSQRLTPQCLLVCEGRWRAASVGSTLVRPVCAFPIPAVSHLLLDNVAVPTQSNSQRFRSRTNRPYCACPRECSSANPFTTEIYIYLARTDDSGDKPPDTGRTGQSERYRGPRNAGASSLSGWGDELVSLNFSSRLKQLHHQKNFTSRNTGPDAEPQQSRGQRFGSKPPQRPQTYGLRRGQREQGDTSQAPRLADRDVTEKFAAARQRNRAPATGDTRHKPQAPPMTQSSATAFKMHSQSSTTPTPTAEAVAAAAVALNALKQTQTKAGPTSSKAKANANATAAAQPTTTTTTTNSSSSSGSTDCSRSSARLAALSSTNLNALFRARDSPVAGTPFPAVPPSTTAAARVRSVLERNAGDYSRFLPRRVGLRKTDDSRLPALRTARHALATQRDVSLEQRRVALHIIGELARPNRQVRA